MLIDSPQAGFKSCPREGGIARHEILAPRCISFKSCPREGGIGAVVDVAGSRLKFQVMPPRGGHQEGDRRVGGWTGVSSHAPARGASAVWEPSFTVKVFQVMPPRGGHPYKAYNNHILRWFQVMPPRGGHPKADALLGYTGEVSSHAPARGASTRLKPHP